MLTAGRCHKAIYLSFLYPAVAFSDAFDLVDGGNGLDVLHDHLELVKSQEEVKTLKEQAEHPSKTHANESQ